MSEKMNILRSAIYATGIDWSRHSTKDAKGFFMTQQPQAKYRHDYRAPDYQITDIDLTFDLDAEKNRGHRNKPGCSSWRA
ncbi:aminopeptidase N [Salmonella enterica subsp. arizonae]|nr:aminopeptidase N [Salmonella enterica subsp. arizonae]